MGLWIQCTLFGVIFSVVNASPTLIWAAASETGPAETVIDSPLFNAVHTFEVESPLYSLLDIENSHFPSTNC